MERLGRQLGGGSILVTGTNGKTTTSRILASTLEAAGRPFIHNREGSNLMRGIAAALVSAAGPSGTLPERRAAGLFETDEATFPAACVALRPKAVVVTNLFRDQLDRYGEVDTVSALWREGLASVPPEATLVLNADDPSVAELAEGWDGPVHWFGLADPSLASADAGAFDARWCGVCGGAFLYEYRYYAHAGVWRCERCDRTRRPPETSATSIELGLERASFDVAGLGRVELPVAGLYNVANALASIAAARALGVAAAAIVEGLGSSRAAFGRQEVVTSRATTVHLFLVKNPAGANQVLRLLADAAGESLEVAFMLSDGFADGRDVSWVWDVDFERLAGRVERAWAGGTRAEDGALRLRYAGWPAPSVHREVSDLADALFDDAPVPGSRDRFLVATYTSMLAFRRELQRRGLVGAVHED